MHRAYRALHTIVLALIVVLSAGLSISAQAQRQSAGDTDKQVAAWVRSHAVKLDTVEAGHGFADMQPLKKIVGNARIVSLGEATHGSREFFQLKHRMLEFLVTQMGFSIFSIEANMPEAYRLNDYVLNGNGDPAKLLRGMYFWTWDTQEVLDMIQWMREINKSGKARVQFTGFDMQTPDVAAQIVSDYASKSVPDLVDLVRDGSQKAKAAATTEAGGGPSFGVATAQFPVNEAAGKRVKFSGYIKTEGITRGYAGLWWRVDGPKGSQLAFDNMHDRGAKGTSDWTRYEIELPVAAEATNINFGCIQTGDGTAWFDGLEVELDGKPYRGTNAADLDFESPAPRGFFTGGNGYRVQIDAAVFHSGKQSLQMKFQGAPRNNFGVATGSFPVQEAAGKRIKFSAYVKTQNVTDGYAGLWWRVDGPSQNMLAFDNMHDRGVTGTTDWKRYEIELPVAAEATNINFGCMNTGQGTAWFDSLEIEVDGKPYANAANLDLDFESDKPSFFLGGAGYSVTLDKEVFHTGKQSVQMKFLTAVAPRPRPAVDTKAVVANWKEIVQRLEAGRTKNTKPDEALEWAIQNARVVLQSVQMRSNEVSRDRSMADNITWILDHSPEAKVVLWAHNAHVATNGGLGFESMGSFLRKAYGDKMVVFGFGFNQGSFQAIESGKGLHDFTVGPAIAGSLDAMMAASEIPIFALDFRQFAPNTPAFDWLNQPHKARSIGAVYSENAADSFWTNQKAPETYDVLLFVEKTTAAHKNPGR